MKPAAWLLLVAACLAPHVARMLGPTAAFVDGIYAHAAWMLAQGHAPYTDFALVAFPLAEGLLALLLAAFGPHVLVIETATVAVVLGTSLALRAAVARSVSPRAGVLAALLWSWSLWVVHFHPFERETWAALGTGLALAALARHLPRPNKAVEALDWRAAALVAAGLTLAFMIKITALLPALAVCLHLALSGRWRAVLRVGLSYAAMVLAVTAVCTAIWGRPFLIQVFLFGFYRMGDAGSDPILQRLLAHGDHVMILGLVGAVLWAPPRWRGLAGVAGLVLAADLSYLTLISPTLWDHNMITLALPCAILGAGLLDRLLPAGAPTTDPGRDCPPPSTARDTEALRGVGLLCTGLLVMAVWQSTDETRGLAASHVYGPRGPGFGGLSREGLERKGLFVARHAPPGSQVACADPWWSFAADRADAVRYWDLEPVIHGLDASLAADGLAATFAKRGDALVLGPGRPATPRRVERLPPYTGRLIGNGIVWVRPRLLRALEDREVAFVLEPLPPLVLKPADLEAAGYERVTDAGLAGWRPIDGVIRNVPVDARFGGR